MSQLVPPPMQPIFASFENEPCERRRAYQVAYAAWKREHGAAWFAWAARQDELRDILRAGLDHTDPDVRAAWRNAAAMPEPWAYVAAMLKAKILKNPLESKVETRGAPEGSRKLPVDRPRVLELYRRIEQDKIDPKVALDECLRDMGVEISEASKLRRLRKARKAEDLAKLDILPF